jgi:hypothetical protein
VDLDDEPEELVFPDVPVEPEGLVLPVVPVDFLLDGDEELVVDLDVVEDFFSPDTP